MKTKKFISILTAGFLSVSMLSGCSMGLTYDKDLVGDGEVYNDVTGLAKLDERKMEQVIDTLNKKYEKIEYSSIEMDAKIVCDMEMGADGMSMNMEMDLDDAIAYDMTDNIMYQKLDGTVSVFGISVPMKNETYVTKDGEDAVVYSKNSTSDEEGAWEKKRDSWSTYGQDNTYGIGGFDKEAAKDVYKDEKSHAYVIELNPDKFEGLDSVLGDAMEEGGSSGMDVNMEKVHLYMSVDEGLGIIGIYADLKDAIKAEGDIEANISDFHISITYKSVNEDLDIKIPDEAMDAMELELDDPIGLDDPVNIVAETEESMPVTSNTPVTSSQLRQLKINGKEIALPCKLSELTAMGLTFDETSSVGPGSMDSVRLYNSSDDEAVSVSIINETDSDLSIDDCDICGIYYSPYKETSSYVSISGFHIGDKKGDVMKILGDPSSTYSSGEYSSLSYDADDCSVDFSFLNGVLDNMSIYID